MIAPWMVATVAPPRHLPITSAPRRTGATSISRMNPNSRSQTIDTAEKIEVNSTVIASTPGNMKVRKSIPAPAFGIILASPLPSTRRNRTGWTSAVTMRGRLRRKRISSRRQTTRTARRSSASRPPASRTGATSVVLAARSLIRSSPHPSPGDRPQALAGRGLGVPDGPPGVAHEHVVQGRPRHADRADADPELGEQAWHELLAPDDVEGHRVLAHGRVQAEAVPQRRDRGGVVVAAQGDAVLADARLQLVGRALHHDGAVVDDGDAVAVLRLVHVVGGEEHGDRLTPPQLVQVGPDLAAGLRVEPDGGLVQEQHPWGVEQAARDLQAALHPAREGAHLAAAPLTEPDQVQDLVQAGGHGVARDPVQLGVEAQVLLGGEVVVQGGVLEDQADAPPHLGLALDHVEAGHAGAPRARPQQRAQHRDGGRLAGAVGPQEPEGLAGRDAEAHATDGLDLVEPLDQALGLDGGGAVGRGPGRGGLPGSPPYSHLTLRCVPAPARRARAGARGSVAAWRPARRGTGRGKAHAPISRFRRGGSGWRAGAVAIPKLTFTLTSSWPARMSDPAAAVPGRVAFR